MENKVQIKYDSAFSDDGVRCFRSWDRIKPLLEEVFEITTREKLTGITISEQGITAHIDSKG